jgi:lipopolysaccharide export system protein LptA
MYSDTLTYRSKISTAFFHGPTTIVSDSNSIFCKAGWYNTDNNTASFYNQVLLKNTNQKLWSDSLYYDRKINYGEAYYNVTLFDSVKNFIAKGQYAEYYEKGGMSYFTDSSMAIIIDEEKDSLFLHADTLLIEIDSNQKAKTFYAYKKAVFFKNKLQGKCDSLVYFLKDSMLIMNIAPIVWGENSQLSGKRIRVFMNNGDVDKINIDTNSFVLQHDSLEYYNQVSGRNMVVHFRDGDISFVDVFANAESVYFVRDEDSSLVGVNLANSSDMRIKFKDGEIGDIVYLGKPKASLNPVQKVSKRALYLRGFKSYEHWRPKSKFDIYIWEKEKE